MSEQNDRNRLSFEDGDSSDDSTRWIYQDEQGMESEDTGAGVRLDETVTQSTRNKSFLKDKRRFAFFLVGGLLLLLLIAGTISYLYWNHFRQIEQPDRLAQQSKPPGQSADQLKDRYYYPSGTFSAPLQQAIAAYENNQREEASRRFENLIQSSASDREKSVALVYLGIMSMETERYALSRHHLIRAMKYDADSVAANVNMAIVERRLGNLADARSYAERARELAPEDSAVKMIVGNLLADSEDVSGAIETYREGIEQNETDPALRYNLALSLLRNNDTEQAILEFSRAIDYSGGGDIAAKSHAHLGQIYFGRGNLELSADHLQKAVRIAPENARYVYNLGIVLNRMGQNDRALTMFERALDTGANDNSVYRSLARAFKDAGQPSLAIRSLRSALVANPQDVEAMFMLADLYRQNNDLLNAVDTYRKIVNITPGDASTVDALLRLGSLYIDLERYNDSIDAYERVLQIKPSSIPARLGLGTAYRRAGQIDRAVGIWKEALNRSQTPGSGSEPLDPQEEKMIRMALAETYRGQGGYDLALQQYRLVESLNQSSPDQQEDPELSMAIAKTYIAMRDYRSAAPRLEQVSRSPVGSSGLRKEAYRLLAESYSQSPAYKNLERARGYINRAQRMDPEDMELDLLEARILLETESMPDREKAIEVLQTITNSDATSRVSSRAYELLGRAYFQGGEYARSVRAYDMALQLDPSLAQAQAGRRRAANAYER